MVARAQLLDAGLSTTEVRDRVRAGRLPRLHPGVYAVGHARLRREGHWLAAVLAAGPGAVLSHRDAAGLHDLRPANHAPHRRDRRPDGRGRRRGSPSTARAILDAEDVTTVSGIPVTTVARTLLDLAGIVPHDHLTKAIKEAERQHTFDLRTVEAAMARTRGRTGRGHRALKQAHRGVRDARALRHRLRPRGCLSPAGAGQRAPESGDQRLRGGLQDRRRLAGPARRGRAGRLGPPPHPPTPSSGTASGTPPSPRTAGGSCASRTAS